MEHETESLFLKIYKGKEQVYTKYNESITYIFLEDDAADTLIVGFASDSSDREEYEFFNAVSGLEASMLFIKAMPSSPENCFIGHGGIHNQERVVSDLITLIIAKSGAENTVFTGFGLGGYAAVNFSLKHDGACTIAGIPPYRLGSFMSADEDLKEGLIDITGEPLTDEKIERLDHRLEGKIEGSACTKSQKFYICSSSAGKLYKEHVRPLARTLRAAGASVELKKEERIGESAIKGSFTKLLKSSLKELTD